MSLRVPRTVQTILILLFALLLAACTPGSEPAGDTTAPALPGTGSTASPALPAACDPTEADMLGPFYEPGAPVREKVGEGYVLTGVVRSAGDCEPVENAMVEFWMAGPDAEYGDEYRAVVYSGSDGSYRFESHFPPGYAGRPPHIHIRVTAQGFRELVTQHYPRQGTTDAGFDLVVLAD